MMSLQGTVCIKFSPKQYMKLYECNQLTTNAKVLTSMVDNVFKKWLNAATEGFLKTISGITWQPKQELCTTK